MAKTSPFLNPRWARPALARRTPSESWRYVRVRPVGPSINAGLSPSRGAWRSTYSVIDTSGMLTSGLLLVTIIDAPSESAHPEGSPSRESHQFVQHGESLFPASREILASLRMAHPLHRSSLAPPGAAAVYDSRSRPIHRSVTRASAR